MVGSATTASGPSAGKGEAKQDEYSRLNGTKDDGGSKDSTNADDQPNVDGAVDLVEIEMKYKIMVLVCASLIGFGSHFAGVSFGSLKTQLVKDGGPFELTNQQYAAVQASNDVLNVFLPLFSGFLLDIYGTGWGSMTITGIVTVGNLITAIGLGARSYGLLVCGRLVYGLGSGAVNIVQQMTVAHWFTGKQLASAMAFILMVNRLGTALGHAIVLPASKGKGREANGMYIATGMGLVSLLFTGIYVLVVQRIMKQRGYSEQAGKTKKPFTPRALFYFPSMYWLMMLVHFCTAGFLKSFLGIATDLLQKRDGTADVIANYKATMALLITAGMYIFLGPLVDRFGQRILLSTISTVFLIFINVALRWTNINSYIIMVVFGIASPLKSLASLAAVPILVSYGHLGTGYAVYKCINAASTTISDSLVGVIQHRTAKKSYDGVIVYYLTMVLIALIGDLAWFWYDRTKYNGLLQKNNAEREEYMAEKRRKELEAEAANEDITKKERFRIGRALCSCIFIIMFNASWIIYLYTTITGVDKRGDKLRRKANAKAK